LETVADNTTTVRLHIKHRDGLNYDAETGTFGEMRLIVRPLDEHSREIFRGEAMLTLDGKHARAFALSSPHEADFKIDGEWRVLSEPQPLGEERAIADAVSELSENLRKGEFTEHTLPDLKRAMSAGELAASEGAATYRHPVMPWEHGGAGRWSDEAPSFYAMAEALGGAVRDRPMEIVRAEIVESIRYGRERIGFEYQDGNDTDYVETTIAENGALLLRLDALAESGVSTIRASTRNFGDAITISEYAVSRELERREGWVISEHELSDGFDREC